MPRKSLLTIILSKILGESAGFVLFPKEGQDWQAQAAFQAGKATQKWGDGKNFAEIAAELTVKDDCTFIQRLACATDENDVKKVVAEASALAAGALGADSLGSDKSGVYAIGYESAKKIAEWAKEVESLIDQDVDVIKAAKELCQGNPKVALEEGEKIIESTKRIIVNLKGPRSGIGGQIDLANKPRTNVKGSIFELWNKPNRGGAILAQDLGEIDSRALGLSPTLGEIDPVGFEYNSVLKIRAGELSPSKKIINSKNWKDFILENKESGLIIIISGGILYFCFKKFKLGNKINKKFKRSKKLKSVNRRIVQPICKISKHQIFTNRISRGIIVIYRHINTPVSQF